ncbi:hypothetical protein GCM10009753_44390 [Streptantibioticus ferralitis]
MRAHKSRTLLATLATTVAIGVLATAPASAAPDAHASPATIGTCHRWQDISTFGGWCEGSSPSMYKAYAKCANGHRTRYVYGVVRMAGDSQGSYAYCSSVGLHLSFGGFMLVQ